MERLLQENSKSSASGLEVNLDLDGFDAIMDDDDPECDLSMLLNSPQLELAAPPNVEPAGKKGRRRRFSMCMDEGLISTLTTSVVATEPTTVVHSHQSAPVLRVMVPPKQPNMVRMAVVERGVIPPGMIAAKPAHTAVLYAHKLPRAEPKVVTAMPVSGGPMLVAKPVPRPMREISTQPVGAVGPVRVAHSPVVPQMRTISTTAPSK
eukprot:TRINITY_DN12401_c0_g1_i1.p1 TRINITY_DN12401_c0_g1~~TRINITY_DN12401_c0_g1_i1.p1  ORF type:complete len:207 (+),score=32.59 TRINITY_DN12401_c0_g1_i1:271-891(+)